MKLDFESTSVFGGNRSDMAEIRDDEVSVPQLMRLMRRRQPHDAAARGLAGRDAGRSILEYETLGRLNPEPLCRQPIALR